MLKRTKGRLLLTLLVVTGFAGTLKTTAPTKQERKLAVMHFKDSKAQLQKTLRGLSESQIDFRPSPDERTIREWFYHLASTDANAKEMLESAMRLPARPEERQSVRFARDEDLLQAIEGIPAGQANLVCLTAGETKWNTFAEAANAFRQSRLHHLKYIKTTTEDLRSHFVHLPIGKVDCYQFLLVLAFHIDRHQQAIDQVMAHPGFPEH